MADTRSHRGTVMSRLLFALAVMACTAIVFVTLVYVLAC